jgi:protein-disulfide isomerase
MSKLKPPVSAEELSSGNKHSENILVEYGDYQCPHCGHAYPLLKKLLEEEGNNFRFVFRNFPLQEAHPAAYMAACAAEAAGRQGKFWEMHDMIFENQRLLVKADTFAFFAKQLGLDEAKFDADLNDSAIAEKVDNDFESGIRSGVNGTPTFFINGQIVDYDTTYQSLLYAIEKDQ